ncbi:O-antigen ligase family protein [Salidesulfovibrio brasiliensis]|uniref:O-antigen ligase family protein n=1 Tax=Salidesulfovibrio brasiliensis TaxID=221711 RepID=UPI0006D2C769|nr:O-antigen ligase family protein [Salidesulfovibrio brasiliensis]
MQYVQERIGLVQKAAVYLLMLVFVGHLAELHPIFMFRGWGAMAAGLGLIALVTANNRQSIVEVLRASPLLKYVLLFMAMVYCSVPFSVYKTGALNAAISYGYVVVFFMTLLGVARGKPGVNTLLGAGMAVFVILSAGVLLNYGSARASLEYSSYDPNDTAYILVSLLPVMFYFGQSRRTMLAKLLVFASLPLGVIAISVTQSRGASLAFIVLLLLILRFEKVSFSKVVIPGALLCLLVAYFVPDAFWERFSTLLNIESDYNYTSDTGRLHLWKLGLKFFGSNPLFGVGAGQFTSANGMFEGNYITAHNAYIQVAAELGIFGIVAFMAMVFGPLRHLRQMMRANPENPLHKGLYIAFFTHAVAILFLSVAYYFLLYYLLALFFALTCLEQRSVQAVAEKPKKYTMRKSARRREVGCESA